MSIDRNALERMYVTKKLLEGIIMTFISIFFIIVSFRLEMFALLWWVILLFVLFTGVHGLARIVISIGYFILDYIQKKKTPH